ncbi:MAG TPA: low molecular weight protein-tyrosine-phosphatase [Longimicrobiales bacterium]|nr:low molecular weight protein-tyrosine-phosphatase [Longimicrobiales bacterium]
MTDSRPTSVLFVCLGNICRSPLAEGVFLHLVAEAGSADDVVVDSAGTGAWHVGERPDPRSLEVAERHGIELPGHARRVTEEDFHRFARIVAMDRSNLSDLESLRPADSDTVLELLRDHDPDPGDGEVPDPYYGGDDGFDRVYRMVRRSCEVLLDEVLSSR